MFEWSLNPYMGCAHRCTFCYVRAFERRADRPSDDRYGSSIRVKVNVADVLARELARPSWEGAAVVDRRRDRPVPAGGGPLPAHALVPGGARRGLEPVLDHHARPDDRPRRRRARRRRHAAPSVTITFSIPTLDEDVWRKTEPSTAHPRQRLRAIRELVDAGIDARVGMAPILPGLSDRPEQLADVVRAARDAGATGIWANLLNLRPGTREHFLENLARDWPEELPATRASTPTGAPTCRRKTRSLCAPRSRGSRASTESATGGTSGCEPPAAARTARARRVVRRSSGYDHLVPSEITCLIVDDHEVVREGLRLSLSRVAAHPRRRRGR